MSNKKEESHKPTVNDIKSQVGCMLKAISQLKSSERSEVFGYIQKCVSNLSHSKESNVFQKNKQGDVKNSVSDAGCSGESVPKDYSDNSGNLNGCEKDDGGCETSCNETEDGYWTQDDSKAKCSLCDKIFVSLKRLYNHGVRHHPGNNVECQNCKETFSSFQIYYIHAHLKHRSLGTVVSNVDVIRSSKSKNSNLECSFCNKVYQNHQHYTLHIEGHKRNKCTECGLHFSNRKRLKQHALAEHSIGIGNDPFRCTFCVKTFAQKRSLLKHYKLAHSKDHIICLSCGATFDAEEELKSHEQTHKGTSFTCSKCDEKFMRKQQYLKHIRDHDKYRCHTCRTSYSNKAKLEDHEQSGHMIEGLPMQHQCSLCEAAFHFPSSLFFHKKTHSGEGHYECKHCKQDFTSISSYREHLSTECLASPEEGRVLASENKKELVCKVCNKLFFNRRKLMKHENKYHKQKQLMQCEICDFKSYSVSCMNRHKELHTKKKEFICEKCGDFFYTKNALLDHLTFIHSEERNFSCEKCGKTFKAGNVLNRHLLSHSSEKPYKCFCGQSYKFCSNLSRHQVVAHGKNTSKRVTRLVSDDTANLMSNNDKKKKKKEALKEKEDNAANSIIYTLIDAQTVSLPLDNNQVIVEGDNVLLPNGHADPQVLKVSYSSLNFPNDNNKSQLVYSQSLDIANLHEVDTILQSSESLKGNTNSIMDSSSHETLFARQLTVTDSSSFLNTEGLIHPPIEPSLVTSLGDSLPNTDQLENTSNQLTATSQQNLISFNEYCLQYNVHFLNM